MKITLKQLNESFASLGKFANDESLTIKQRYWLSRIAGAAESEMTRLEKARVEAVKKYGEAKDGNWNVTPARMPEFEAEMNEALAAEIDLPGDPIKLDALSEAVKLTALDLTRLSWLIVE
jgi:hypothetical protein